MIVFEPGALIRRTNTDVAGGPYSSITNHAEFVGYVYHNDLALVISAIELELVGDTRCYSLMLMFFSNVHGPTLGMMRTVQPYWERIDEER